MISFALGATVAVIVTLGVRRVIVDRRLRRRLRIVSAQAPTFDPTSVNIENLAALATASNLAAQRTTGGWRRRLVALIGSVGIVGWTGAVAAGASAGLAATGNLPDPIQQVVADVLEGVNIEVPAPDEEPVDDDPVGVDLVEEDPVPAVPAPDADDSVSPDSGDAPGNSGDAPGNSGSAPGNSGDAPGNSGSAPGNSGDAPGNSGSAPGNSGIGNGRT